MSDGDERELLSRDWLSDAQMVLFDRAGCKYLSSSELLLSLDLRAKRVDNQQLLEGSERNRQEGFWPFGQTRR